MQEFLSTVFKDVIVVATPKIPEMMKIVSTDPFLVFCFLQSIYSTYLDHDKKTDVWLRRVALGREGGVLQNSNTI